MANRALILYASSTGNTEKVALIFRDVLTEYGWVPDLVHLDEDTDLPGQGIYLDHYDLVLLGSPVISGSPSPLVSRHLALVDVDPPRLYSNQLIFPGSLLQPERAPLGIVFVTYSGETFGPSEALPALELESMYLKYLFLGVIGKFACPGRKAPKSTIDLLASELGLSPDEVAQRIGKYERNPADPVFSGLSEDALALLHQAVMDQKNGDAIPVPEEVSQEVWHRNLDSRPHSRDLQKARIFLEEILEDYFTSEGLPRQPGSVYTCIG